MTQDQEFKRFVELEYPEMIEQSKKLTAELLSLTRALLTLLEYPDHGSMKWTDAVAEVGKKLAYHFGDKTND